MKDLRTLLENTEDRNLLAISAIEESDDPGIICAGLAALADFHDDPTSDPDYRESAATAIERLFTLIAQNSREDEAEFRSFLYRVVIRRAEREILELYRDHQAEYPIEFAKFQQRASQPESKLPFPWPIVVDPSSTPRNSKFNFRDLTALKLFGYTVGKTNGWPQKVRRNFLGDFMERELPSIVKKYFGDEYGTPMSVVRLRKTANILASNVNLRICIDRERYSDAITDWLSDLLFLKQEYYEKHGLKFYPWPEIRHRPT